MERFQLGLLLAMGVEQDVRKTLFEILQDQI